MDENEIYVVIKKDRDQLRLLGEECSMELFEFFANSNLHIREDDLQRYAGKCIEYICDINKKAPREEFHLRLQGRVNEILNSIYEEVGDNLWEVVMGTTGGFFMMCNKRPFNAPLSEDDKIATVFAFKLACFECMMKMFREDDFPLIIDFWHCFNNKEKEQMLRILSSAANHMAMSVRTFSREVVDAWRTECKKGK